VSRGGQGGPTRGARAAANRREAWRDGHTSAPFGSVGSCPEHVHLTLRRDELTELASHRAALEERRASRRRRWEELGRLSDPAQKALDARQRASRRSRSRPGAAERRVSATCGRPRARQRTARHASEAAAPRLRAGRAATTHPDRSPACHPEMLGAARAAPGHPPSEPLRNTRRGGTSQGRPAEASRAPEQLEDGARTRTRLRDRRGRWLQQQCSTQRESELGDAEPALDFDSGLATEGDRQPLSALGTGWSQAAHRGARQRSERRLALCELRVGDANLAAVREHTVAHEQPMMRAQMTCIRSHSSPFESEGSG
jgi:hypothetical protein